MSTLSNGSKVLVAASAVLFIDLFLSWQKACAGELDICASRSGFHGIGVLVGLLVLALIAWEIAQLTGNAPATSVPAALISAGLGGAIMLFTIVEFLTRDQARHWPAWLGLILAFAIGYGAWERFNEAGGADAVKGSSADR